ncbi:hypothetical protein C2E23DRAFT_886219 [Lenzites betulinus]|nr:hypothetical protein C2E23DRAFT_886639 [Lenzites betulinus]KAH9852011.1 hypothetical protein C2E23DRAFT_886219 [Lenzites betulinus]
MSANAASQNVSLSASAGADASRGQRDLTASRNDGHASAMNGSAVKSAVLNTIPANTTSGSPGGSVSKSGNGESPSAPGFHAASRIRAVSCTPPVGSSQPTSEATSATCAVKDDDVPAGSRNTAESSLQDTKVLATQMGKTSSAPGASCNEHRTPLSAAPRTIATDSPTPNAPITSNATSGDDPTAHPDTADDTASSRDVVGHREGPTYKFAEDADRDGEADEDYGTNEFEDAFPQYNADVDTETQVAMQVDPVAHDVGRDIASGPSSSQSGTARTMASDKGKERAVPRTRGSTHLSDTEDPDGRQPKRHKSAGNSDSAQLLAQYMRPATRNQVAMLGLGQNTRPANLAGLPPAGGSSRGGKRGGASRHLSTRK